MHAHITHAYMCAFIHIMLFEYFTAFIFHFIPSVFLVHPCDKDNNGNCEQICTKKGDWAKCDCNNGFKLAPNETSCIKSNFYFGFLWALTLLM